MKKKQKLYSIALTLLLLLFLILGSYVASAGTETRLTNGALLTDCTAIYNNIVTWSETAGNGVHVYDLASGKEINIGTSWGGNIPVYDNKIVWDDIDQNIIMYNLSTNKETKISSNGSSPDIYGNYVVYTNCYYCQDHKSSGIYLYNLNTCSETKIATVHGYPVIYDKKVIWSQANSNNGYDICMYDISTNQTNIITTTNSSGFESEELDIYEDTVVWIESGNVYMCDITSHKITQVTNSGNASQPAVYGKRIVYNVGHLYRGDINIFEISTANTTQITTSTRAFSPSIHEDKIVYAEGRDSKYSDARDIYLYDLSSTIPNPPVADFYANVTSGTASLTVLFAATNKGGEPASLNWDFVDGIDSNHEFAFQLHTFTKPGNYTIGLTVENAAGSNTATKPSYIIVTDPNTPVADVNTKIADGYAFWQYSIMIFPRSV